MPARNNAWRHDGRICCGEAAKPGIWRRTEYSFRSTSTLNCLRRAQPANQPVRGIYTTCRRRVRSAVSAGTEAQSFRYSRGSGVRSAITTGERIRASVSSRCKANCLWHTSFRPACSTLYDICFRSTRQGIHYTGIWTAFTARERSCFRATLSASWWLRVRSTIATE
jgi:hypothetical protein